MLGILLIIFYIFRQAGILVAAFVVFVLILLLSLFMPRIY